jgi:hypothetical protein
MEVLHPELQLQSGEGDVVRGLLAANMAQDYMESVFALHRGLLGDTVGTVTTTANTETTTYPTGLLRIDKLQYLDAGTARPVWDLDPTYVTGGHAPATDWLSTGSTTTGKPRGYWTNGRLIYWDPLPDGTHTVRWYGLQAQADLTAAGTILYPDVCLTPLANCAVRLIRTGLDDDTAAYVAWASELFEPVVQALAHFQRERAPGLIYRYGHTT